MTFSLWSWGCDWWATHLIRFWHLIDFVFKTYDRLLGVAKYMFSSAKNILFYILLSSSEAPANGPQSLLKPWIVSLNMWRLQGLKAKSSSSSWDILFLEAFLTHKTARPVCQNPIFSFNSGFLFILLIEQHPSWGGPSQPNMFFSYINCHIYLWRLNTDIQIWWLNWMLERL